MSVRVPVPMVVVMVRHTGILQGRIEMVKGEKLKG